MFLPIAPKAETSACCRCDVVACLPEPCCQDFRWEISRQDFRREFSRRDFQRVFLGKTFGESFLGTTFGESFLGKTFGESFLGKTFGESFLGRCASLLLHTASFAQPGSPSRLWLRLGLLPVSCAVAVIPVGARTVPLHPTGFHSTCS